MKLSFLFFIFAGSIALAQNRPGINFKVTPITGLIMIKEIGKEGFPARDQVRGSCLMKMTGQNPVPCSEIELILLGPGQRQFLGKLDAKGAFQFSGLFKGSFNLWIKSDKYRLEKPIRNLFPGLSYSLFLEPKLK